jgi:hypothetical protein
MTAAARVDTRPYHHGTISTIRFAACCVACPVSQAWTENNSVTKANGDSTPQLSLLLVRAHNKQVTVAHSAHKRKRPAKTIHLMHFILKIT